MKSTKFVYFYGVENYPKFLDIKFLTSNKNLGCNEIPNFEIFQVLINITNRRKFELSY